MAANWQIGLVRSVERRSVARRPRRGLTAFRNTGRRILTPPSHVFEGWILLCARRTQGHKRSVQVATYPVTRETARRNPAATADVAPGRSGHRIRLQES